jgi:branched-chain amino acid transport system substrate-binding protein
MRSADKFLMAATKKSSYKVLMVQSLTGPLGTIGSAEVQGMRAAAAVLNRSGGIQGHTVEISTKDDQGSPTVALSEMQSSLSSGGAPNLVFAGTSTTDTGPLIPLLTERKVLSIEGSAADNILSPIKDPYNFSVTTTSAVAADSISSYVKQHAGKAKIGILSAADAYGQAFEQAQAASFTSDHLNFVTGSYSDTDLNLAPDLTRLKSEGAQYLVFEGFGAQSGYVLKARAAIGWKAPALGGTAVSSSDLSMLVSKSALNGVELQIFNVNKYISTAKRPAGLATFLSSVGSLGAISQPLDDYSYGYDALMLASLAAKQASSISLTPMVNALTHLSTAGSHPYVTYPTETFTPTNHYMNVPVATAYTFVPAGPIVHGMIGG